MPSCIGEITFGEKALARTSTIRRQAGRRGPEGDGHHGSPDANIA
jgi:hypothetical protein